MPSKTPLECVNPAATHGDITTYTRAIVAPTKNPRRRLLSDSRESQRGIAQHKPPNGVFDFVLFYKSDLVVLAPMRRVEV